MSEEEPKLASDAPAPAPAAAEEEPKLSKNALKKKLKAERAAKLKAEKEAAKVSFRLWLWWFVVAIDFFWERDHIV